MAIENKGLVFYSEKSWAKIMAESVEEAKEQFGNPFKITLRKFRAMCMDRHKKEVDR